MDSTLMLACGAVALELRPGERAGRLALDRDAAAEIAGLVARDVARFAPWASAHDLAVCGAVFDPVELLRPGLPLHAELANLLAAAPSPGAARVAAFAGAGLPVPLQPELAYADGPLRLLPWVLRGPRETLAPVADELENSLLDSGMAPADTALVLQAAFAAPLEHARYLTAHDVAAMMSLQYEHAGLGALWPLVEAVLFGDTGGDVWLDHPPEPLVRLRDGVATRAVPADVDPHLRMRLRQVRAVLEAHAVRVDSVDVPAGEDPRERLA